ncbi:PREDICTED: protein YIF1A isoform X2 [Camelina sativa]|uniref:Protein YIF1A isoform X2 n=1 Tax=Camelina sativa TaxID=90675 RepID=A0ABM1R8T6_CAMSA|nr:PREDICTED: protein YIF1A isoform X2 [Camelina sativa]
MYNNMGPQPGMPMHQGIPQPGMPMHPAIPQPSPSEYVQSNISRYFSDPQYYFQVNDQYVRNKLKIVLFPFLHRGHWTRISEPVGGRLSYKPPIYDINAPDLYIPLMAFGTYVVLAGLSLGLYGKFSPEALNWLFVKGMVGWFLQVMLLKISLLSLGSGEAPLLDIVAYAGYTFTGLCLAVLFAEARSYDSSRHHYLLIFVALAQFPLLIWLGNISVNWLF